VPVAWFGDALYGSNTTYQISTDIDSSNYYWPNVNSAGGHGGIFGIVTEDSAPASGYPVALLDRPSLKRIGYTLSEADGGYEFNGINSNKEYIVLGTDPTLSDAKNAIVWDHIVPINSRSIYEENSSFMARRLRDPDCGPICALDDFVAGAYAHLKGSYFGGPRYLQNTDSGRLGLETEAGATPDDTYRYMSTTGHWGLNWMTGGAWFGARKSASDPLNYEALSFEYIFVPPGAGDSDLFISWGGINSSTFRGPFNCADADWITDNNAYSGTHAFCTLQVTASAINFRMGLGGRNRDVVRATGTPVAGAVHHVIVTYAMDDEIKMYINGTLVDTTSIAATARPYANPHHVYGAGSSAIYHPNYYVSSYTSYDFWTSYIACPSDLTVSGPDLPPGEFTTLTYTPCPSDFGGQFGLAGIYGRTFDQDDVDNFYASFNTPSTHIVPIANSGYPAEVEADNPFLYMRCNETATPPNGEKLNILVGDKAQLYVPIGTPTFGNTGFTGSGLSVNCTSGVIYGQHVRNLPATFSIECCIRISDLSAVRYVFTLRSGDRNYVNQHLPVRVWVNSNGAVVLSVSDKGSNYADHYAPDSTITTATDYHLVIVYDQWDTQSVYMYVNGTEVYQAAAGLITDIENAYRLMWGGYIPNSTTTDVYSSPLTGDIGEIALYGFALPAERVAAHYAAL
jgi:hypothetical protein